MKLHKVERTEIKNETYSDRGDPARNDRARETRPGDANDHSVRNWDLFFVSIFVRLFRASVSTVDNSLSTVFN